MDSTGTAYRKHEGVVGEFDAIVIGSGMGGLSVASLLAQEGQRILLLEQHNVVGGMTQAYTRNGYRWTVGMHYIGEVGSTKGAGWKLFNRATGGQIEWSALPAVFNRMVIGEQTYEIPAGMEAYGDVLKEHFPSESAAIDTYLMLVGKVAKSSGPYFAQKAMPLVLADKVYDAYCTDFHQYSEQLTIDVLRQLTTNEELIAVLCANWGDYSLEPSKSSFAMHCMLAKHYVNGAHYPVGGGSAFAKAMVPIIENAGGRVLHSAEVEEIMTRDDAVTGVRLTSGEVISCPNVISNAGVQNTFGRLLSQHSATEQAMVSQLSHVRDAYAVVGINIGFKGSNDQVGLSPANIWAHPSADLEQNLVAHRQDFDAPFPWCFITFPSTKDPHWERDFPGKSTVEMYAYTDYRHFAKWADTTWMKRGDDYLIIKEQIKQRLLAELYRHIPNAEQYLDYVEVSTPLSYETFAKRQRGGFMGIEASPQRFAQKWLRAQTPIHGLYLTGQDIATDGVIGALVGGVIAASAYLKRDLMTEIRTAA